MGIIAIVWAVVALVIFILICNEQFKEHDLDLDFLLPTLLISLFTWPLLVVMALLNKNPVLIKRRTNERKKS